jgi:hypothetical protein
MTFVLDLARKCKEVGEKLVVVSHSIVTLDFIQHLLLVFGINVNRLDGSTPQEVSLLPFMLLVDSIFK